MAPAGLAINWEARARQACRAAADRKNPSVLAAHRPCQDGIKDTEGKKEERAQGCRERGGWMEVSVGTGGGGHPLARATFWRLGPAQAIQSLPPAPE